jgi:PAS domain S-box-containing protein
MLGLHNISIRHKQMLIIVLTSAVVLLLAGTGFVVHDILNFRRQLVRQAATTAAMIGNNCTASLDFNDPQSAAEILAALRAEPNIRMAGVYDRQGTLFARFVRDATTDAGAFPGVGAEGAEFTGDALRVFHGIAMRGERVGTIYLAYDLDEVREPVARFAGIGAIVLVVSLLVAFALSIRLQRVISEPVMHLAHMTRAVAKDKNYAVRAIKQGEDELGDLIDGFNAMLAQIQTRDLELQAARDQLERRVEERTSKLAESLSLLNATLESTADGILVVDLQGKIASYNAKFVEMWRLPHDLLADTCDEHLLLVVKTQLKAPEEFLAKVGTLFAQPTLESFDLVEFKDGRVFERYSLPQRLEGRVLGRVWSFRDVTERKRSEREIADSRNFLDRIINSISDPIFVKDRQHRGVLVNDAYCSLMACERAELIGKSDRDHGCYSSGEADEFESKDELVFETGKLNINEESFTAADGTVHCLITKKALYTDEQGNKFIVGVIRDITEWKMAEEALRESQARFKFIFESVPVGIASNVVYPDGRVARAINEAHLRICGLTREQHEIPGIYDQIIHPDDLARQMELVAQRDAGLIDHYSLDKRYVRLDGSVVWVAFSLQRRKYADGTVEDLTTLVDITALKQAQEEAANEQARLKFVFETVPVGIALNRRYADGRARRMVNDAHLRICGLTREQDEMPGIYKSITHPDDFLRQEALGRAMETAGGNQFSLEKRYLRRDGEVWVSFAFQRRDYPDGSSDYLTTVVDITENKRAEAALRESQGLYLSLVEQLPVGVFRKDKAGRYVFVNPAYCKIKGLSADRFIGRMSDELVDALGVLEGDPSGKSRSALQGREHHEQIMRTGEQIQIEEWYPHRQDHEQHLHVIKSPVFDGAGEVVGSQGILIDITQRKQAEVALAHERYLLHSLLDTSPDAIYFKDAQSRFTRCSQSLAAMFQVAGPEDIVGRSDFDFHLPDRARIAYEDEQRIMRTGQAISGKVEADITPRGERRWVITSKMPLRDAQGKIIGTFGISKDITELRRAQEAAALEQARFKFIFDSVPIGISLSKNAPDGRLLERLINDAHLRICGLTPEQNEDLSVYGKLTHPDDARRHAVFSRRVDAGEIDQFSIEKRYVRFDDQTVWVLFSFQRRRHADGTTEDLCTVVDITKSKEAEEEREKYHRQLQDASRMAGMAEVASNVLHNVGNVLNSVNVSATLVADNLRKSKARNLGRVVTLLDEHAADLVGFLTGDPRGSQLPAYLRELNHYLLREQEDIAAELESLRNNIGHIKDIVAMQQNYAKVSGQTEVLDVTGLIEDSLRINAGALVRHNINVVREFATAPEIEVDKHKVLQILVNLIRNAQYACDESGREDKQLTVRLSHDAEWLRIAVIDNGVGIPAENLTRIFNHGFTTRKTGHGFGLHSGALAAREMGGTLRVHSDGPGCGATFTLELPVYPSSRVNHPEEAS